MKYHRVAMNRKIRILFFSALSVVITGCGAESRLNVILISLDTLRADHLGCYGYSRSTSPFLDQLAERGTLFETAIVQLPGTLPSHMSMFTGLYPNEHGVFPPNGVLRSNIPTLPEILHNSGYRTAGFTEGGFVAGHFGFDRGFDRFDDEVPKLTNDVEVVFSRGLEFLQEARGSQPFFLFLHTYAIHDPYYPPLPYTTLYLDGLGTPESYEDQFGFYRHSEMPLMTPERANEHSRVFNATRNLINRGLPPGADLPTGPHLVAENRSETRNITPEALAYYTSLYDASINYVDDVLRAFFGSLEKLAVLDDTIIIITSDHGEEFLEHGKLAHEQVYQECLHVPLIILSPEHEKGRRVQDIVRSIDFAPTIYELTRVVPPTPVSGLSLVPLLEGSQNWPAQEAFARDSLDTSRSLHTFDQRLLQAVVHKPPERYYSRVAHFSTDRTEITFSAEGFHTPREVEILVDGSKYSTVLWTPGWQNFELSFDGEPQRREFVFQTPDCDVPAEVIDSIDQRCLSFRIAEFPRENLELFDLDADPSGTTDITAHEPVLGEQMANRMEKYGPGPVNEGETVTLSPDDIERLKSLGYLQ
jgi:arylsulfatase A-like enzyme